MKVSQSFVVASLSVAAQTQVNRASPLPDSKETDLLSPRLNESQLVEVVPTRLIPRGFGRRALPSQLLQASANLDSRHRTVSLNVDSKGRVNRPPLPSTPSPLQQTQNHRQQFTTSGEANLLQASLGSRTSPSRPVDQANQGHLLDLSLKLKRRYIPDDNHDPADPIPGTVPQVSGNVAGSVPNVVSSLPSTLVGTLSDTLESNPLGIPSDSVIPSAEGLLSSTSMITELSQSLPASLGSILSSLPIVNQLSPSGLPIVGQILTARSDPIVDDPSSSTSLDDFSSDTLIPTRPPNPFHQASIAASNLLVAGGAFPIQPSHSLDGQVVANEPSIPNFSQLLKDAQAIKASGSSSAINIGSSDGNQDQDDSSLPSYLSSQDPTDLDRLDDASTNPIGLIPGSLTANNGSIPIMNPGEEAVGRILPGSTSKVLKNDDGPLNEIEELDLLSTLKGLTEDPKMNLELGRFDQQPGVSNSPMTDRPVLNKVQQDDLPSSSLDQPSGSISSLQVQLRKKLNLIPSSLSLSRLNLPNFKASTPTGTDPDPDPSTTNPSSSSSNDPSSSSPNDQTQNGDDDDDGHQPRAPSSSSPKVDPDQDPSDPNITPLEEKAINDDQPTTINNPPTPPPTSSSTTNHPDQKTHSNSDPPSSSSASKFKRWLRKRSSNLSFKSSRHQS